MMDAVYNRKQLLIRFSMVLSASSPLLPHSFSFVFVSLFLFRFQLKAVESAAVDSRLRVAVRAKQQQLLQTRKGLA